MLNKENNEQAPAISEDVIKIVDNIIRASIEAKASDIHFEPQESKMITRFRIDGSMNSFYECDLSLYKSILSRIKVMADLDLTGPAKPQEGNFRFYPNRMNKDHYVDLRISIFPTSAGQVCVMRVLETKGRFASYSDLGFSEGQLGMLESMTHKPNGLVLVTGPTGSGKSTTLFTILNKLNDPDRVLSTLEDPVERKMDMVRQTEVNPKIGLDFAEGLRYLLRQDPDILMVGEIRDRETAKIAVQASITGHLVLATIHTNNAAGAIVRLINMGIEPFMLSSALKFVTGQRLVRKLCDECKTPTEYPPEFLESKGLPKDITYYRAEGCSSCNNKGVKGRIGIHEVLPVTKVIEEAILLKPSDEQINKLAISEGMKTLQDAALDKLVSGEISLEELIRVVE
ncbi:hypothetical protein C0584_02865 [Candidatus Parcubacteria bacterium]|nr:MAG: hypothetical protein C0584_02865 [Candidatus Parcubacteria bacterium]